MSETFKLTRQSVCYISVAFILQIRSIKVITEFTHRLLIQVFASKDLPLQSILDGYSLEARFLCKGNITSSKKHLTV